MDKYSVRNARHEDRFVILELLNALGLTVPSGKDKKNVDLHWDRLWKINPSSKGLKEEDGYIGHVLEYEGEIVGFFGSIPRMYLYQGEEVLVSVGSQWGIQKPHRKAKNLLIDAYFNNSLYPIKLATTAIKQSGRIYANHDGYRIPLPDLLNVKFRPLKSKKLMEYKLPNALKPLSGLLSLPVNALLSFRNKAIKEIRPANLQKDKDPLTRFISRQSDAAMEFHSRFSVDELAWYLELGTKKLNKELFVCFREHEIVGYSILCEERIPDKPDLRRMKLLDLRFDSEESAKKLLLHARQYAKESNMDVLEFHHNAFVNPVYIPYKTFNRILPQFPFFYQSYDKKWSEILSIPSNWRLSPFDGDTSIG